MVGRHACIVVSDIMNACHHFPTDSTNFCTILCLIIWVRDMCAYLLYNCFFEATTARIPPTVSIGFIPVMAKMDTIPDRTTRRSKYRKWTVVGRSEGQSHGCSQHTSHYLFYCKSTYSEQLRFRETV